jgi:carbamoyltransferase
MVNIGFYGSHNAALVIEKEGEIILVLEIERFLNYKNSGVAQYKTVRATFLHPIVEYLKDYILKIAGVKEFDNCFHMNTDVIIDNVRYNLEQIIPAKNYIEGLHHEAHAAGAFYQSPYKEALAFSFDGGGNDGFFNIYHATRKNSVKLLESVLNPVLNTPHIHYDLGFAYMLTGNYLEDIRLEPLSEGNLVFPGKVMGLVSYGKVRKEWVEPFIEFYKSKPDGLNYNEKVGTLADKLNLKLDIKERLEGKTAYDFAATSQLAFEECFIEIVKPYIEEYKNIPIIISGGCALNIILNTRIKKEFKREVFVGPNPNDCGLAAGLILHNLKPKKQIDITYSGTKLLDFDNFGNYIQNHPSPINVEIVDLKNIATDLSEGKIIGVARGRSEHGPRALGNRSILCNPAIKEMKDILNKKVKNREWYRPFAPVVRLEDVSTYFEWEGEARWMSFCPKVKKKWQKKLPSITHVDGTARVQTVTKEQNKWLYDLLTLFKEKTGVGVLLNTSFNVNGKPILSTVEDAFQIFNNTELDSLIIEKYYVKK